MNVQTVTLVEVLAAARARQASLVPESAGYLMLGLGRAMAGLPLGVSLDDVHLGTDGAVTVRGARAKLELRPAAERMRELLQRLLSVAQETPSPLRAVVVMSLEEGDPLERLFTAITKALIPLNRSAAKRALARLSRETLRARARGLSIDGELTDLQAAVASNQSEPEALPDPEPRAAPVAEPASEPAQTGNDGDSGEADEEIDVVFELASPSPQPVRFELATPTPPPPDEPAGATAPASDDASLRADDAAQHEAVPDEPEPTPTVVDAAKAAVPPPAAEEPPASETPPSVASAAPVASGPDSGATLSDAIDEVVDQLSAALGAMVAPDASDTRACCDDSEEDAMVDDTTEGNDGREARASALEAEAELAERLLVSSAKRRSKRERSPSKRRTRMKERILSERDDELLSRFGADEGSEDDAVQQAAASLSAMMALDLPNAAAAASLPAEMASAAPGSEAVESAPSPVAESPAPEAEHPEDELEPSTMTPPELRAKTDDAIEGEAQPTSLAPATVTAPRRRLARASVVFSALLLLGGLGAAALLQSGAERWLPAAAFGGDEQASPASCTAELALRDLPSPHEVLLGLGRAPLSTRLLPTGVRLELVAMAPGHQPQRLLVPADAVWREDAGQRMLSLKVELAEGPTMAWPVAPPGEVGGVGPAGIIGFEASPAGTELWLVIAAGTGDRASVTVPCDEAAHLLVLSPDEPTQQRRASVEPELLRAAAGQGPAELSLKP